MNCKQDRPSPYVLASKPSSSFSTASSAASATSAATSRSGASKLLFGEIDTNSDRSSESYASVCNFVLCDSSTFLKFWLEDRCRDTFLSHVDRSDLASLRLACHDFSVRAAPALFEDLSITFKTNTFTKPSRLAALDRLGFYVKKLTFAMPHTTESYLPPLINPDTGEEMSFTYTPQVKNRGPKYGDEGTTDILTRQYPPLFHAATNVPAFVRAFSSFVNLQHLAVSCPGYDPNQRYRRSIVDYALISLRIAVEKNCLNCMDALTLSPIHPGGLMYLSPMLGFGASPRSASRWSTIRTLTVRTNSLPLQSGAAADQEPDQVKLIQTYLRNHQTNLKKLDFRWLGDKGAMPFHTAPPPPPPRLFGEHPSTSHPALAPKPSPTRSPAPLHFTNLTHFHLGNTSTSASSIGAFVAAHKRTIEELNLEDIKLTSGTWDEALAPITKPSPSRRRRSRPEVAEIPIMLSPSTGAFPAPMERVEVAEHEGGRKSLRVSKWLGARKVREGLLGCERELKRVLRGGGFAAWR